MRELIIKCTSKSEPIITFFHRSTIQFNEYYKKRENKAYFETTANGFLYILPDLETYKRIAQSVPDSEQIQILLKNNKNERNRISLELMNKFNIQNDGKIILDVEITPYKASEVFIPMKKVYLAINPDIEFLPIDEKHFSITFPNLDAFIDYNTVFLLSIRPVKQK